MQHNFKAYDSSDALIRYAHLKVADDDIVQTLSPEDETFLDRQEERRQLAIVGMDSDVLDELESQDDLWLRCKEIDKPESQPVDADFEQLLKFNE